jgi:hypothetical protein
MDDSIFTSYDQDQGSVDDDETEGVSARWNVIVPDVREIFNRRTGESYTGFKIIVNDERMEWYIWKRYREFHELHQKLSKKHSKLPAFPPRRVKLFIDDEFLELRRQALEAYLKGLDYSYFEESEDLRSFLGVYETKNTKPISDGVKFSLSSDDQDLVQVIISDVPSIQLSNGQSVFLPSLLETTQTCLQQLDHIKQRLDRTYGYDLRLEFLNSVATQRNDSIDQLEEVKIVYTALVEDELVKEHFSYELLERIHRIVNRTLKWGHKIERSVMLEVSQQTGVWDRIKEYQTEAEAKVTLLLQLSVTEPEYSKTKEQLKLLEEKIRNEHQACHKQEDAIAMESLEKIMNYIRSGYSFSTTTTDNFDTRISRCETELFSLVDMINKLTIDNTEEEFLSLKRKLTILTKDISSLRNTIEKQLSNKENLEENKSRVDHLEDLQENLSDLTYTFSNKFEAYSTFLTEKNSAPKKKNNTDVLYEL